MVDVSQNIKLLSNKYYFDTYRCQCISSLHYKVPLLRREGQYVFI